MAPEYDSLDVQSVQESSFFEGGSPVKIHGKFRDWRGLAITRAVRNEDTKLSAQGRDRVVERIDLISPPAVQKEKRNAGARIAIIDAGRAGDIGEGRVQ